MATMVRPALLPMRAVAWIDLLNRVVDGADALAMLGYLYSPDDPDECVWCALTLEVVTELANLVAGCKLCRVGPRGIVDHWLNQQQAKYERALPTWTCGCGAVYKRCNDWGSVGQFYQVRDDGLLGECVGGIRHDSKGKVTHSDLCPACGESFARTLAAQTVPEGALF